MSLLTNDLLRNIAQVTGKEKQQTKLATVTEINGDNIYLTYYGDTEKSLKPTKRLSSYTAQVGDVVMVQNINDSYVITGKVV